MKLIKYWYRKNVQLPLVAILLLLCLNTYSQKDEGISFLDESVKWADILADAGNKNQLIFLDCYTTWCGPCKAMAKDVFPLPEVGKFMNANFINVKKDMEKGEGIDLQEKYKKYIPGYPTYLLINSKGTVVHQVSGYNDAQKFISKMKDGLEQKSWVVMSQKFIEGERSWGFLYNYLSALESGYQSAEVKKVVAAIAPSFTSEVIAKDSMAYRIFRKYWTDAESPLFLELVTSPAIYRKYKDPERDINEWAGRLYKTSVQGYVGSSINEPDAYDTVKANKLIEALKVAYPLQRENLITLMLLSKAAYYNRHQQFLNLVSTSRQFGLLRYDTYSLSNMCKALAAKTTDKKILTGYADLTRIDEKDKLTSPGEYRNHAFIVEKMGNKTEAARLNKIADEVEADMRKRLGFGVNNVIGIKGSFGDKVAQPPQKLVITKTLDAKAKTFERIDSFTVTNRNFAYESKTLKPGKYNIVNEQGKQISLFLDYGQTNIAVDSAFPMVKVTGNITDSVIKEYEKVNTSLAMTQLAMVLMNKKYTDEGKTMPDSLVEQLSKAFADLNDKKKETIKNIGNRKDMATAYVLANGAAGEFSTPELNTIYTAMSATVKGSPSGESFKQLLDKINSVAVGVKAPDFTEKTPEGTALQFSSFMKQKKLVLIDFWASWCGPCRKENPNVVALYNKFKDKGFDIIGVSLDSKKEDWEKAIATDQLTWAHVSDLGGWQTKIAQQYNVSAVPHTVLVGANGVIIAKNLRGKDLEDKVAEICNGK